jgi:hypothetical protein
MYLEHLVVVRHSHSLQRHRVGRHGPPARRLRRPGALAEAGRGQRTAPWIDPGRELPFRGKKISGPGREDPDRLICRKNAPSLASSGGVGRRTGERIGLVC